MTLPLIMMYGNYTAGGTITGSGGGTTGPFNHDSVQVITSSMAGAQFTAKATAAPLIYDNCSGTAITDLWSGGWPDASGAPYNLSYMSSTNGVAPAHSHVTKYATGVAYPGTGANSGWNVMGWKNITVSLPQKWYISHYNRCDPTWQVLIGSPADGNFKTFDWSIGTSPYDAEEWYGAYFLDATTGSPQRLWFNAAGSGPVFNQGISGSPPPNLFGGVAANPIQQWIKTEQQFYANSTAGNNSSSGYFDWYEDCVLNQHAGGDNTVGHTFVGHTDSYTGTGRNISWGGYNRDYDGSVGTQTTQRRYFNDIVLDNTWERVVAGNNANYSSCTIREYQPATIWTTSSITFTAKLGKLTTGTTCHIFVIDTEGSATHVTSYGVGS